MRPNRGWGLTELRIRRKSSTNTHLYGRYGYSLSWFPEERERERKHKEGLETLTCCIKQVIVEALLISADSTTAGTKRQELNAFKISGSACSLHASVNVWACVRTCACSGNIKGCNVKKKKWRETKNKRAEENSFPLANKYKKELICLKSGLMTLGCYEKDLRQITLMRSKPIIQFWPATSTRRCIIKLRFTDANSGIIGQLCKSPHAEKSEKPLLKLRFNCFFLSFLIENPFQAVLLLKPLINPSLMLSSLRHTHKYTWRDREWDRECVYEMKTDI